ncbi:hypothetical protein MHK_001798 [Candidatus Magnetomorum sp. HK-1]|nr:hypothetical protein MHK_001798 [Candidatus Magnetomorum sp. HK-1]
MALCEKCVTKVEEGQRICKACETYKPVKTNSQKKDSELKAIIQNFGHIGNKYDCIVPLTGGKDSSYVLYYMTKVVGARVLAFTYDNGLFRDGAQENMKNAIETLGCDHVVSSFDEQKLNLLYKASFRSQGSVCLCPLFLPLTIFPIAIKEQVPLIVSGFSSGQRGKEYVFSMPETAVAKQTFHKVCQLSREALAIFLDDYNTAEKNEDILNEMTKYQREALTNIEKMDFFPAMFPLSEYAVWNSFEELYEILGKHLNWKRPSQAFSRTSCRVEHIKGYTDHLKNDDSMRKEISHYIRQGMVPRERGIEDLSLLSIDGKKPSNLNEFLNFIDITETEFDSLIYKPMSKKLLDLVLTIESWLLGRITEFRSDNE